MPTTTSDDMFKAAMAVRIAGNKVALAAKPGLSTQIENTVDEAMFSARIANARGVPISYETPTCPECENDVEQYDEFCSTYGEEL